MLVHIGNRTLTPCADKHMVASRRMLWRYLSLLNTNLVVGVAVVLNRCVLSGGGLAQIQSTEIPMPSIGATSRPGPYSWSSGHQQLEAAIQLPPSSSACAICGGLFISVGPARQHINFFIPPAAPGLKTSTVMGREG